MSAPAGDAVSVTTTIPEISEDDLKDIAKTATKALKTLDADRTDDLLEIQKYLKGDHPGPYMPSTADPEYRLLAKRSTDNWIPTLLKTPTQALYVEGHQLAGEIESSPAWESWQRCRLDGRQTGLYRDALAYGESYAVVDKDPSTGLVNSGMGRVRFFPRLMSIALYEDPTNDPRPAFFLHVKTWATSNVAGTAEAWDREHSYDVAFDSEWKATISNAVAHDLSDCPAVPFVPYRDLSGKPEGILRPLFGTQDRINQTTFDRLLVQTSGAFKVRYATGMVPPPQRVQTPITLSQAIADGNVEADDPRYANTSGDAIIGYNSTPVVDPTTGEPVPAPIEMGVKKLLVIKDAEAKVGTLEETPLDGYLAAIDQDIHRLAARGQLPPYYLGVDLANLSADALAVAESSLWRMIAEFQHSFGESWEQVMQLLAEVDNLKGADQFDSEVIWRDTSAKSIGQVVDALGKAAQMLGIPGEALWSKFPGVTGAELAGWKAKADDASINYQANPASNLRRSVTPANAQYQRAIADPSKVSTGTVANAVA